MKRLLLCALALLPLLANAATKSAPAVATQASAQPRVSMQTSLGTVVFELDASKAPKTVANFLAYVKEDGYRGSLFHRVIPGFVVQGGGYDGNYLSLPNHAPVQNESKNGLSNQRGTIAMARTSAPHSATRQFYVNLQNNSPLDGGANWGYTVFGKVVSGQEVLDRMAIKPTGPSEELGANDVPLTPIVIKQITLLK